MATPTWDCEYGNYKDMNNERNWRDDFFPRKKAREDAQEKYKEWERDILNEIAHENGLDTSGWDTYDYWDFQEIMGL